LARIEEISGLLQQAARHHNRSTVTLSTVHSAKGLEFDRVMIVDLFEGRFPLASSIAQAEKGDRKALEEERRLFYVAVTRARKELEIVTAQRVYSEKVKPSRFIRELLPRRGLGKLDGLVNRLIDTDAQSSGMELGIQSGMGISHRAFGRGEVTRYDSENDTVSVRFPKYGVKTFCAEYSILHKILLPEEQG
jgi:DNA helicase-2/ATP-dependent DNA helicase PcrA